MRNSEEKISGLQKAAILLISLGPEKSANVFKHLKEEEIDNKIAEMAKNVGKEVEEVKKTVNNDYINRIANELLMKKIINFLHENNEIK